MFLQTLYSTIFWLFNVESLDFILVFRKTGWGVKIIWNYEFSLLFRGSRRNPKRKYTRLWMYVSVCLHSSVSIASVSNSRSYEKLYEPDRGLKSLWVTKRDKTQNWHTSQKRDIFEGFLLQFSRHRYSWL